MAILPRPIQAASGILFRACNAVTDKFQIPDMTKPQSRSSAGRTIASAPGSMHSSSYFRVSFADIGWVGLFFVTLANGRSLNPNVGTARLHLSRRGLTCTLVDKLHWRKVLQLHQGVHVSLLLALADTAHEGTATFLQHACIAAAHLQQHELERDRGGSAGLDLRVGSADYDFTFSQGSPPAFS